METLTSLYRDVDVDSDLQLTIFPPAYGLSTRITVSHACIGRAEYSQPSNHPVCSNALVQSPLIPTHSLAIHARRRTVTIVARVILASPCCSRQSML